MRRAVKWALPVVAVALAVGLAYFAWQRLFVFPRVERFPEPVATATRNGPAPTDHHFEVAVDLIDALGEADFQTPGLARAAEKLEGRMDARLDNRARHVLARMVTLGSTSNVLQSRRSIHLPTPGAVIFRFTVPAGARLEGHVGLLKDQKAPATFTAHIDGEEIYRLRESPMPLFRYNEKGKFYKSFYRYWNVELSDRKSRWVPFRIDLSAYQGREVLLRLATQSESGRTIQAFWGAPAILSRQSGPPGPVILYIADAANTLHFGAYGSTDGLTPHFDSLAAQGARVESFISSGNWSRTGVTAMFTGRPCPELFLPTGPTGARIPPAIREVFEASGIQTLATEFRRGGYRTLAVVNNHFVVPRARRGVDLGFDGLTQPMRPDISTMDVEAFVARTLADHRDENLFLYVHQNAPNPTDIPPQRFRRISKHAWKNRREMGQWRYLSCLAQADFTFGRFLEMIEGIGWGPVATVALTADHGQVNAVEHEIKTPEGPHKLRRAQYFHGQTLYDEELRIPFLIRGPKVRAGLVAEGQFSSLSVFPTLLRLAGLPVPDGHRGTDLSGFLTGADASVAPDPVAVSYGKDTESIRVEDRYKYIRWKRVRRQKRVGRQWVLQAVREELFDLEADPMETRSLVVTQPDLLARMRSLFDEHVPRYPRVWSLLVSEGVADEVEVTGAVRIAVATGGRAERSADGAFRILTDGELRAAAFPDPDAPELLVVLYKEGVPLAGEDLRFGAAWTRPPIEGSYRIDAGTDTGTALARDVPPSPDGKAHPHLCLMELPDWISQVPDTGETDVAVKELLRQWGYVQ